MEQSAKKIMNNYMKEISLFQDLLNCIIRERDHLINQDVKGIWDSLEEKESILASIEQNRSLMKDMENGDSSSMEITPQDRDRIREHSRALARLKLEIKSRVKENVTFINETLSFFHEMISAMTMSEIDRTNSYGPSGFSRRAPRSAIYQGEV
jgi:hypothetical protein